MCNFQLNEYEEKMSFKHMHKNFFDNFLLLSFPYEFSVLQTFPLGKWLFTGLLNPMSSDKVL